MRSEVHARHEGQKYAALGGHEVGAAAIQAIEANFLFGTVAMAHSVAELRLRSEVESVKWAAKQEKLQPLELCFFLTSPFRKFTRLGQLTEASCIEKGDWLKQSPCDQWLFCSTVLRRQTRIRRMQLVC
jgi:hypothetical protein